MPEQTEPPTGHGDRGFPSITIDRPTYLNSLPGSRENARFRRNPCPFGRAVMPMLLLSLAAGTSMAYHVSVALAVQDSFASVKLVRTVRRGCAWSLL